VRTHLEYANSAWAPYKQKHIDMIEGVRIHLPGLKNLSYEDRLKHLELPTFSYNNNTD